MTYNYHVWINTPPKRTEEYRYTYAKTKNIAISITKAGARIVADMGKDYSHVWKGSYAQELVQDGIRRCALIYLMKYNKPMKIKTVVITIYTKGKRTNSFDITESIELYSLIEDRLQSKVATNLLSSSILEAITYEMKKDYGNRAAALYAYLLSKSKKYEAEKFVYLWMAFNGVYSYWGKKAGKNRDTKQIIHLLNKYKWGSNITPNEDIRTKVGKKVALTINSHNQIFRREDIGTQNTTQLDKTLFAYPEMENVDITLYGYLLCDFCYYLRCTMIHANKPLPLFSFENEMDIQVLRTANNLLEDFLDNHLYECFKERD